jgi:hypothetical protein
MEEGKGFEPSIRNKPYNRLAICRLQPLGHPSSLEKETVLVTICKQTVNCCETAIAIQS